MTEPMTIERVRVLNGHTDPDTAYLVDDYPYGGLRCQIRYWIETAAKGAKKGQQRFMSQTTNPKQPETVWNKPKGSTYTDVAAMYLDHKDHVQWWGAGVYLTPAQDAKMRLMGIYDQFTDTDRARYDVLLAASRRYQRQWDEWEERLTAIVEHIRATGEDPAISEGVSEGGTMTTYTGRLYYLEIPAAYLAVARQRIAQR